MTKTVLGIIGGSGIYQIEGLQNAHWRRIESPWGEPSDELLFGNLEGVEMVFLPRHGKGHRFLPHSINYRANLWALRSLGVRQIFAPCAVGSLRPSLARSSPRVHNRSSCSSNHTLWNERTRGSVITPVPGGEGDSQARRAGAIAGDRVYRDDGPVLVEPTGRAT